MNPRRIPAVLGFWMLLLPLPLHAEAFESAPRQVGGATAQLLVHVSEQSPAPGRAVLRLTAVVRGGAGLEVRDLTIEDARKAWEVRRPLSSWSLDGDQVVWGQGVELLQREPGPQPIPPVRITFRADPGKNWEEVEWTDVLREPRPGPDPETVPDPQASGRGVVRVALAALLVLGGGLAMGYWRWRRARVRRAPVLSAEERALRAWQRLQEDADLRADARRFHTALSDLIRAYLAECLGVHAPQQTSAEFLRAIRQVSELTGEQRDLLAAFSSRCDLAKFAPGESSPEACRETADLARQILSSAARES